MGDNSSSNEITFIYALIDPRTKQIRYVGKSDNPHGRLVEHLREKGALDKNQWLYNLLREGQQPELRILEEVPLHPPYLWQEREQWWIIHLRKQGAQLTNVVYGGEDTLPRETLGYIPRHRKWKGHYKPNLACVQTLLDHLAAGWDDKVMDDYPVDTTSSPFPKLQCIESCTRLPTGTVIWGSSFNNHPEFNITWFCRCSITVPHTLSLGVFPIQVSANDRDRKAKIYPTEPGTYESYIWKEQTQDCLDAGCQVTVHHGFAWNEWTRDNQAFLSLCRELWQYAPMPDESERPLSESGFLYYLAKYLMATPPYPEMLHWFSYAIMQSDRLWYHSEISGQI